MSLKEQLSKIFEDDEERVNEIHDVLNKNGVFTLSDFEFLDEEILTEMNYCQVVEITKILEFKMVNKDLKKILEEIFGKVSAKKLQDIEKVFEVMEIYAVEDLALINIEEVAQNHAIFSHLDIEKIKNYIRKNYPERFMEIKVAESHKLEKYEFEFKLNLEKELYVEECKPKYLETLYMSRDKFMEEKRALTLKLGAINFRIDNEENITKTLSSSVDYKEFNERPAILTEKRKLEDALNVVNLGFDRVQGEIRKLFQKF